VSSEERDRVERKVSAISLRLWNMSANRVKKQGITSVFVGNMFEIPVLE
jgi:hypothetical protein